MRLLIAIAWIALCAGCASTLTPEEREYQQAIDLENWVMCEKVYEQYGKWTIHRDHSHTRARPYPRGFVKQDLADNNCRKVLGEYWAEY